MLLLQKIRTPEWIKVRGVPVAQIHRAVGGCGYQRAGGGSPGETLSQAHFNCWRSVTDLLTRSSLWCGKHTLLGCWFTEYFRKGWGKQKRREPIPEAKVRQADMLVPTPAQASGDLFPLSCFMWDGNLRSSLSNSPIWWMGTRSRRVATGLATVAELDHLKTSGSLPVFWPLCKADTETSLREHHRSVLSYSRTYTHGCINLSHGFFICGELVYLDSIADQLAHDLTLEFVQFVLGDGVSFCNYWNDVHL